MTGGGAQAAEGAGVTYRGALLSNWHGGVVARRGAPLARAGDAPRMDWCVKAYSKVQL